MYWYRKRETEGYLPSEWIHLMTEFDMMTIHHSFDHSLLFLLEMNEEVVQAFESR